MTKAKITLKNFQCQRSLGYLTRRLHNTLVPRMERLFEEQEITFVQWVVLVSLRDNIVRTAAELSRHLSYDSGATTRLLDQLESRGYVKRLRSKDDRRVIFLTLTPTGASVANTLTTAVIAYWNRTLGQFSQTEFDFLIVLMTKLLCSIEEEADASTSPIRAKKILTS